MEKYGQPNDAIINNLRNEEAQLMTQIQNFMCNPEKVADQRGQLSHLEARLAQVRGTITEFDLKDYLSDKEGHEF